MRLFPSCLALLPFALGCSNVLGLGDYAVGGGGSTTGTGGTTGSGGTATGGTGGVTSTAGAGGVTGGAGGTGGVTGGTGGVTGGTGGTGGATVTGCTAGDMKACYDGPAGTEGQGLCKGGTSTCDAAGVWGPCLNEVLPSVEQCKGDGVDENCDLLPECGGAHRWSRVVIDSDALQVGGVATDGDDDIIVVGSFKGALDLGGGVVDAQGTDVFVLELDRDGKHLWSRTYAAAGSQVANAVAVDKEGSVFLTGTFASTLTIGADVLTTAGGSDAFVAKLDKDGAPVWARSFGGSLDDRALGLALTAAGEVVVTGGYNGAFNVGATSLPGSGAGENVLLIKLDGAGNPLWAKGFGDASSQLGTSVAIDVGSGAVWVGANATGNLDFGCGTTTDAGGGDIVIGKLNAADGSCVLAKRFGDPGPQVVSGLVAAPGNGVYFGAQVTGTVSWGGINTTGDGTLDVAVGKMGPQGGVQWVKRFGALGLGQYQQGIATDTLGNVVLTGSFAGSIDFSGGQGPNHVAVTAFDRYVAKLGPTGLYLWSKAFSNSSAAITSVAVDRLGYVDVAGNITGQTDLGGGTIGVAGSPLSLLLAQFAP